MAITIALAGNPNSGKTTLFNALTGANQFVGNWPGVTVEKKEGKLKGRKDVTITDLPGIYSLSSYTPEEVVSRNYLIDERPDAILNIIDGTNLERNLFLTTQLVEMGIPVVLAVNMMDEVDKRGDKINAEKLESELGCKVVEISALKGDGVMDAAMAAVDAANSGEITTHNSFSGTVEHALAHIEDAMPHNFRDGQQRFFAIKLFERDEKIIAKLGSTKEQISQVETIIAAVEAEFEDDCESIITTERYRYIDSIIKDCVKLARKGSLSISDKIDKIVTNRWLALPIFAAVMFIVYFVSVTTVGTIATDWANDGVFGDGWHLFGIGASAYEESVGEFEDGAIAEEPDPADFGVWVPGIPVLLGDFLESVNCAEWLQGLILDGIVAGVGAVLGFVPQMLILFIFLAFLESCGYMARIAFIMDRIFRRFGLSGKSFIPILIGTGCGVPG
ncbi:MAG: ferrous iron transporter B, partial [Oscillospiraceae bacterium]|nr:ferrous iron transporter B [Oscillospiraceae bacterium]